MKNLIIEPLKFYEQVGKIKHEEYATQHFETLLQESGVNVLDNRKTCDLYRKQLKKAEKTEKRYKRYKTCRTFLIVLCVVGFLFAILGLFNKGTAQILMISLGLIASISSILIICLKLNKLIKNIKESYENQKIEAQKTLETAYSQVSKLNSAFSEKDAINLVEKTVPDLKINRNYALSLKTTLQSDFDFNDNLGENASVLDTLSGTYNQNPFLFYRYLDHHMGTKIYQGSLLISWTERRRNSNGTYQTVRRTQTLHAQVSKPFPYYNVKTAFAYAHQSAPDLRFSRQATDIEELNDKQVEMRIKKGRKKLKKREENAIKNGASFTGMANEKFDVIFGALDRDNEVQFRAIFSPLAQINMVNLLRSKVGYGDDFYFAKKGKINHIISEHAQLWDMDTSPIKYFSYDVDIIKKNFLEFNKNYFKSIFFDFAPVLSIPDYHGKPSLTFEPLTQNNHYTNYEYQVMANAVGRNKFSPHNACTESILSTQFISAKNQSDCVMVTAKAYKGIGRTDYIPVVGGDGRIHSVPVPWVEYLPVQNKKVMLINEVGLDKLEFQSRLAVNGVENSTFTDSSAYYHDFFAKIVDDKNINYIDDIIQKVKKI